MTKIHGLVTGALRRKYISTQGSKHWGVLASQSIILLVLWNPIAASDHNSARHDGNSFIHKSSLQLSIHLSMS